MFPHAAHVAQKSLVIMSCTDEWAEVAEHIVPTGRLSSQCADPLGYLYCLGSPVTISIAHNALGLDVLFLLGLLDFLLGLEELELLAFVREKVNGWWLWPLV